MLPSLRVRILQSFLGLVALYAALGVFLVASVFLASRATPKLLSSNYDSIEAAEQMRKAWHLIVAPQLAENVSVDQQKKIFGDALNFEEKNLTEDGERLVAQKVRDLWNKHAGFTPIAPRVSGQMDGLLDEIVRINRDAMFELAESNNRLSHHVLLFAIAFFLVTLILAVFAADGLANRLARPLKSIAEALHGRPSTGKRLKLPEPNSLEVFVLTTKLAHLWERLGKFHDLNVTEVLSQKTKLETVLASIEDGLVVLDQGGHVAHFNARLLELIGLESSQVIDKVWRDLPSLSENYMSLRDLLASDMGEQHDIELESGGKKLSYAVRSRPITGGKGVALGTVYLLHDITERKQRETLRAEFINLLSHELKTPLQSLGTASELLTARKAEVPEDLRLMVETVAEDTHRIRAVANEFVQITQSTAKVLKLRLDEIDLKQVLPEWIKPFIVVARDRKVAVELKMNAEERQLLARVDVVKFPWVISNLLSNAIRFSPEGTTVKIFAGLVDDDVEIRVDDEGPGVAQADEKRIFEPFFQARLPTGDGRRGLFGVGLTIAKEVIEAHDGEIAYNARPGGGSSFWIRLPAANGSAQTLLAEK